MAKFPGVDYLLIDTQFSEQELMVRQTARQFVDERVIPVIRDSFRDGRFPKELIPEMGRLGFFGANLEGYGCAGMNNVEYGLLMQELERGDSGVRSFASVQGGLVMYPILTYGTEEQRQKWLPRLQSGEAIGPVARDPGGAAPAALNPSASLSFWLPCYNCYTCYKARRGLGFCGFKCSNAFATGCYIFRSGRFVATM